MLVTVLLLALVGIATMTDFARRKIYNWTTYPGILAALAFGGLGSWLLAHGVVEESQLQRLGWIPLGDSLYGLLACGLPMLVWFVFVGRGGGDVKLMAMLGALLGLQDGLEALLWTFVVCFCLGLSLLVWRAGPWRPVVWLARYLAWMLHLGGGPLTAEERELLRPPPLLPLSALAAVVIVRFRLLEWLP